MAGMSLTKLNELLERALRSLHEEGLTVVTYQEPKPWLPESYWAEVARREAETLIDLAKHKEYMRQERALSDKRRSEMSAAEVMAEWEQDVPRLQGDNTEMRAAGWGRPMKHSGGTLRPPTDGPVQPSYDFECYQCGRPITNDHADYHWTDHAGKADCDHAMLPQDMIDAESYWWHHTPKPWHGEEEDDDEDES